ncbi:hypothetical protein [Nonomuraea rhizosphaerae]|uniref:hypothetical protein n=1 Tax=Nonomuraea rhizosphaerae TaxID=2665663 RepID=UPI001C5D4514|nr:hypothetical protein [Nonomuraea rhizosphaerae]
MHWHAYQWTGNGADRGNEAERRPTSPDFSGSALPPMRTGDWLLKSASRSSGRYDEAKAAADWMATEFGKIDGMLLQRGRRVVTLEERIAGALDLLPRGVDVQWGDWLRGGRFATIGMICCPNRHVTHPCPLRRRAEAGIT